MTDEEQAFRAAIDAAPDDEAPHKVYADWLDDHNRDDEAAYQRRWTMAVAKAEQWLKDFCNSADCPPYEVLMGAIKTGTVPGDDPHDYAGYYSFELDSEYLHFGGYDAHGEIPPEFWDHVATALGIKIGDHERPTSFSCSC